MPAVADSGNRIPRPNIQTLLDCEFLVLQLLEEQN